MANFFEVDRSRDLAGMKAYIRSHNPQQMMSEIRSAAVDPNDVLDLAEMIKVAFNEQGRLHAKVLYAEVLREPDRLQPDVDVMLVRRDLCACSLQDDPIEALAVIRGDSNLIAEYPALCMVVAIGVFQKGRAQEASWILSHLEKLPSAVLIRGFEDTELRLDDVKRLRLAVKAHLAGYRG